MRINVIDALVFIRRICEAYGATLDFRHARMPIVCTLPYAGMRTGEVVQ